jgi:hypothetical protein
VVRQLKYSTHNENSIDTVLFLNGFPHYLNGIKKILSYRAFCPSRQSSNISMTETHESAVLSFQAGIGSFCGRQRESLYGDTV